MRLWLKLAKSYERTDSRPSFQEAYWEVRSGQSPAEAKTELGERRAAYELNKLPVASAARLVSDAISKRPELAAKVGQDPMAMLKLNDAEQRQSHNTSTHPRSQPQENLAGETIHVVQAMLQVRRSMERLVEHVNGARRAGFIKPADLRDFAETLRLYADAIDGIADSRGLTDEALAEWISG